MIKPVEHIPNNTEPTPEEQDQRIIKDAKEFFIDSIPTKKQELIENLPLSKLLDLYIDMMDREPTLESFVEFLESQAVKNEKKDEQTENYKKLKPEQMMADPSSNREFKKFLLEKLPRDLPIFQSKIRQLSDNPVHIFELDELVDEFSTEELLDIHKQRKNQTILGFHVSSNDIEGDKIYQSSLPSVIHIGDEVIEIPEGYAHYNLNPKIFYKGNLSAGGPNFLYLVEGSSADAENYVGKKHSKASGEKQWLISASPIKIRAKIQLTPRVLQELGINLD